MRTNKTNKIEDNGAVKNTNEAPMSKETCELLFMEAVDLAYEAFEDPDDEHVECIYMRLRMNHCWGLGALGAVTVH